MVRRAAETPRDTSSGGSKRVPIVTSEEAVSLVRSAIAVGAHETGKRFAVVSEEPRELWWAWIAPSKGSS